MMQQQSNALYTWRTEPEIELDRQKFLSERLAIEPDVKNGIYPFKDIKLTRADIEWLLVTHEEGLGPVDWSDERQRNRSGIDVRGADLRQVDLRNLPLARLYGGLTRNEWQSTTLERRDMAGVHLERAILSEAHLERAILQGAHLDGATLRGVYLQGAALFKAYLRDTYLRDAHLEQANLKGAWLEGADLRDAHLEGADLRYAFFDKASALEGSSPGNTKFGFVSLADVHWGDVNLAVVNWRRLKILGDEAKAREREARIGAGTVREKGRRFKEYQAAVRANRQLANAMRAQGMNEEAIPFAYRAQILQRKVYWRQVLWGQVESTETDTLQRDFLKSMRGIWRRMRSFGSFAFSWFLDILAGYGYKPGRSLLIYILMIAGFATLYNLIGHLSPREALIFSVTSFHGRGFFPGPLALSSPLTGLAAIEAVIGLFIEISFIATFTQRFFGR